MASFSYIGFLGLIFMIFGLIMEGTNGAIMSKKTQNLINKINNKGPYLGVVIPNLFEQNPLLNSPDYTAIDVVIDISGRRFRFGKIGDQKVVSVMTGLGMINAGITTQLLLSFFNVEGVVHYGIAGNANPSLNIGDVAIPQEVGYLKFADYAVNVSKGGSDNVLNNIWYQPEENLELEKCINSTTCLSTTPKVYTVERGTSASIYLDNAAYRSFIYDKFKVSPVDMESAAVALISLQQRVPYIAIRALSDLAGGGSADSNEADIFINLAADNSIIAVLAFIKQLSAFKNGGGVNSM
ncbi:hypothetical protein G4B88_025547 [Cannabis sativa]|uniref:Nucleoside phosphorylase domain-containing protein n=1 Tax=Cannabis sativa TaxID=3483 RepID=A0A7J6F2H0_CANSA|nr:hypothetical protein G4B88_025547 [Cannabis sativa]